MFFAWSLVAFGLAAAQVVDKSQYVNVFLGTQNGGNMFPGAARPLGMVKLGPDCYNGRDAYSGYLPDGNVTAYSMMHESGTGGAPKYGVVAQMPFIGNFTDPSKDRSLPRTQADTGRVGYYRSSLANGVTVELAATHHAGMYQYTSPSTQNLSIIVDVSHVLPSFRGQGLSQGYAGGSITVFDDGHYEASGTYNNGWNRAPNWRIYSCGRFNTTAASFLTFSGTTTSTASSASSTSRVGAVFTFPQGVQVLSTSGVSFISSSQACRNIDNEISPQDTIDDLETATRNAWNTEILGKITTPITDTNTLRLLYSSLYGMFLLPSNRTGENPLWTSSEPYYDDTFTYWDLFRCATPLSQIIHPVAYEESIRSAIDIWRFAGYLPDARSSNYNGATQGGSNADNVLADAYIKGVRGKVNWQDGYSAMVKDAEVQPVNNNDPRAPDSSTKEGRGALPDWKNRGYITPTYSRAVSRAMEYSLNDFSLSQVAAGLGRTSDRSKYLARSRYWRNHWNSRATSLGFSGFIVPRLASGAFVSQDPLSCGGCYWGDPYYQGLPWEYSVGAHHDMAHLISLSGGSATFTRRLDKMFQGGVNRNTGTAQFNYTIMNPANEPDFATPYLYNFVQRQDLSTKRARYIAKTYYNPTATGLPGNSDSGAMQAWLLWNMIGLYPLTGQTTFLIHAPWFSMNIDLGNGKTLAITTSGGNSDTAFYVQSLTVNGVAWRKNWLTWNDVFANGGTMRFVLGPNPSSWFNGPLPPSPAST